MVVVVAVCATEVDVGILWVKTQVRWVAQVQWTEPIVIEVLDAIEVYSARTRVLERGDRVLRHLAFHGKVPHMAVGGRNMWIYSAQARARRWNRTYGAAKRPKVIGQNRLGATQNRHIVIWRVLNYVKGHVAEVPLVGHAITATQAGLAISEQVIGKANSRSKVVVVGLPHIIVR